MRLQVIHAHVLFPVISSETGLFVFPHWTHRFCWHFFPVICILQSGPFFPHQNCFSQSVSVCLLNLPSPPDRATSWVRIGSKRKIPLCPKRFCEARNWLKGCQHKHCQIALSCTPSKGWASETNTAPHTLCSLHGFSFLCYSKKHVHNKVTIRVFLE